MAYSVTGLTDYIKDYEDELIKKSMFDGRTVSLIKSKGKVFTGIKSSENITILDNPIGFQADSCGFNASGDVTFTQRNLATSAVKFQDTLCPRTLETKWTQMLLKKGQNYTEADIPKKIIDNIVGGIMQRLETADWQGDTTSISAYLDRYDGLIKIIKAATGTTTATASTYNLTNARAIIANIVSNIPAALKGNPAIKIFMGYDAAETYRQALMNANLYHVPTGTADQHKLYAEGSVHEIIPVHGLDGLTGNTGDNPFIFALNPENVILGVDMENEEEQAKMWYSMDDDNVKYSFRFRRGWQIAFPTEIVEYSNS